MNVAFIGLGTMGAPMARNVIAAGHAVAVFDTSEAAAAPFRELRCRVAASPSDAAEGAQAVVTMLPDSGDVREALLGAQGARRTLAAGALVVEMSTIGASASDAIALELSRSRHRMVDAPVGRTPRDAAQRTLLVIAGGDAGDVAEARPLFECFADTIVHAGPRGHGIRMKLVNNYMATVGAVLTAEALTLAGRAGLDRATTVKVLGGTTAGRGHLLVNYPRKVLAGDVTPDFPMRMAHKDVTHALALGAELGSPLLLGSIAREMFGLAKPWGRGEEDWTAVLLLMEDLCRAGHFPATEKAEAPA